MLIAMIMAAAVATPDTGSSTPAPTTPAATAAAPPADLAKKKDDPDQMVCRKEQVVGSLLPNRVCMTRAQWTDYMNQSRKGLESQQRAAASAKTPGS